jgi:hypothetical protein
MTSWDLVLIDGKERKSDALRLEIDRTVNGVGTWSLILRNTAGKYNAILPPGPPNPPNLDAFDVQYSLTVQVDSPPHAILGGRIDGPAVKLRGRDLESIWDEYVILNGVDMNQDLLFHNDFDADYPNTSQLLDDVMDDVFNTKLAGLTNILYTPVGGTPPVGSIEFREGASFLTQIQELHKRAGYVFYVDDGLQFRSGAPGFSGTGVVLYSSPGVSNIIDVVDYQERDGDKHYNYVKLYGKNPMFDGWTELNASSWTQLPGLGLPAIINIDRTTYPNNVKVGEYSQVACNINPLEVEIGHILTCTIFHYTSWNFSKGEIGIWAKYDNIAAAPGAPAAGSAGSPLNVECKLTDILGNIVTYWGSSTMLYEGEWGYCTFPLGEQFSSSIIGVQDSWCAIGAIFDWDQVVKIQFKLPRSTLGGNIPSHFYIDGISLPIPCISIIENPAQQAIYRRRPYVDSWSHIRTQNALDNAAAILLPQMDSTAVSSVKLVTPGDYRLRYAGQSFDLDIPALGINSEIFYITQLHHIIEPQSDVSNGYGFDWVTEITACPTSGMTYDMSRLRTGPAYSATQMAMRGGVGVRIK